jgi:ribonucleotide reductase alpha subunit
VDDLKKLGMWNLDMLEKIKFYDGSIQQITEIPPAIREKYKEVFEMEPQWLVKAAAYRGRWIDMSQSLNIFYGGTSGKVLSDIYQYAWGLGLKTTYYLRTMGASRIEKSTVDMGKFGSTSTSDVGVAAQSIVSSIIVEETVAVLPIQPHESPSFSNDGSAGRAEAQPVESPSMLIADVVASIEQKQVEAGQMQMPGTAPHAVPTLAAMVPNSMPAEERGTSGIPTFGAPVAVKSRPKIEIVGEACESCSA